MYFTRNFVIHATCLVAFLFCFLINTANAQWSEKDKKKFRAEFNKVKEFSSLGSSKIKFFDCLLEKCEVNYTSFEEADGDEEGAKKLAEECLVEVMSNGSVLGNWSDKDKNKFRADMRKVKELSNLGNKKNAWIECYLAKCEENYSCYFEANLDEEGVEAYATECASTVMGD